MCWQTSQLWYACTLYIFFYFMFTFLLCTSIVMFFFTYSFFLLNLYYYFLFYFEGPFFHCGGGTVIWHFLVVTCTTCANISPWQSFSNDHMVAENSIEAFFRFIACIGVLKVACYFYLLITLTQWITLHFLFQIYSKS